jgi:hypothetical protein
VFDNCQPFYVGRKIARWHQICFVNDRNTGKKTERNGAKDYNSGVRKWSQFALTAADPIAM